MKRLAAAFVILAVIISLWRLEAYAVGKISDDMTERIELVIKAVSSEDFDGAVVYANEFYDKWGECETLMGMLVAHEITDEITLDAARLRSFSASDGSDEAFATAMEIKELLREIKRKREVNLTNVL